MSDSDDIVSLSGAPILRHATRTAPFEPAIGGEDGEFLERHIERYAGKVDLVDHELLQISFM